MDSSFLELLLAAFLGAFLAPLLENVYSIFKFWLWDLMTSYLLNNIGFGLADLKKDQKEVDLMKSAPAFIAPVIAMYIYFGRISLKEIYTLSEITSRGNEEIEWEIHDPELTRLAIYNCFITLQSEKEGFIQFKNSKYNPNNEILSRSIQVKKILGEKLTTSKPAEAFTELLDRIEQINNLNVGFWGVVKITFKFILKGKRGIYFSIDNKL